MPAPTRRFLVAAAAFLLLAPVAASTFLDPAGDVEAPGGVEVVGEDACPESEFTCITLRVPRDHFAAPGGPTFDVTFGLLRATSDEPRGAFVTVTGGPGTSGLAVADGYTGALDPRIPEEYDIVFFDQRGIGLSEPLQCPDAVLDYYLTDAAPEDRDEYAREAEAFVDACVDESDIDPEALAYLATRQAVEDLEAFLEWLGADQLQLYGESYGTQFAQQYALAHSDRVAGLFLDGPVDLTLEGLEYYGEQSEAFAETLELTLEICTDEPACDADTGGDPLAAYDALATELADGPLPFDFVTDDGAAEERDLSLGLLEAAAAASLYSPYDRMLLQRALAYASRGDLLPLARLGYLSLGQDPETLDAVPDPTFSDAMYYAVECADYEFPDAAGFFEAADEAGVAELRLGSIFFGDLPCAYWPAGPATDERPQPLTAMPFPVWVLASTADPATPIVGALRIFERLDDGYLIVQEGGPHVIFGRGDPCPDEPVTAFLLSGELPETRRIDCAVDAVDPYAPLPAPSVDDYAGALEAMWAADDEILSSADFWNWDGVDQLVFGCLRGGTIRYEPTDVGYAVQLDGCEMTDGLPLTGSAIIDDLAGTFELSVTAPGGTDLRYLRDAEGGTSVEGEFEGDAVSEEEPAA
ncbi:MAG: alpha/beta hydrolase [Candidatus Limnocylindria bacterium]